MKLTIEIDELHVTVYDEEGYEVVHWVDVEWMEDPSIVPAIANAIRMASEEPERLIKINQKHINSQKEIENKL